MIYLPERYYFKQSDFPLLKSLTVIAKALVPLCTYYVATLKVPKKGQKDLEKKGRLSDSNKEKFIENTIIWLSENTDTTFPNLFNLDLSEYEEISGEKVPKFTFHGIDSFAVNISEEEFDLVQEKLIENNLPEDVLYEESRQVCIPEYFGIFGKFFNIKKCFSPKEWKEEMYRRAKEEQN